MHDLLRGRAAPAALRRGAGLEAGQEQDASRLRPAEGTRDAELARLVEPGAVVVADDRKPDGTGWVTFSDPEGNEFCIQRSEAEAAA